VKQSTYLGVKKSVENDTMANGGVQNLSDHKPVTENRIAPTIFLKSSSFFRKS